MTWRAREVRTVAGEPQHYQVVDDDDGTVVADNVPDIHLVKFLAACGQLFVRRCCVCQRILGAKLTEGVAPGFSDTYCPDCKPDRAKAQAGGQ